MSGGVVIEIALNQYDRRTLVARAGGQVTQRANKVGELTRSRALRRHVTNKGALRFFITDRLGDRLTEGFTGEILIVVVSEILELELIGRTDQTVREGRRNDRIGQLPDLILSYNMRSTHRKTNVVPKSFYDKRR